MKISIQLLNGVSNDIVSSKLLKKQSFEENIMREMSRKGVK